MSQPRFTRLFIATSNAGKLREMIPLAREVFGKQIIIEGRSPPLDEETGATYLDNAWLKARALHDALTRAGEKDFAVLADDSGLSVDALGGRPGVHSARYAGDHVDPVLHIKKLLRELGAVTSELAKRTARYHCALAFVSGATELSTEGTCEGKIGFELKGSSGFGYDPVFIVDAHSKSFGELSDQVKQDVSHRRHAFNRLRPLWEAL